MKKVRPKGSPLDKITFPEFIWYLTHTLERDYDEHWAPYGARFATLVGVDLQFLNWQAGDTKTRFSICFQESWH
ncbi:hypothetical protein HNY73_019640 [Argiope bruennichi]|uniref:Uncharacterized protein n=1 Tax=Argiope bruennichi TaxID=94029 RepID=A0A8T0E6N5_ARGBR|nr:hypothetical protein HNY73_019640 [Argiope bruennichi]